MSNARKVFSLWAGLVALSMQAQWGVRFVPFQFDRVSSLERFVKWQVGLGLDFDTSPRTAISVIGLYGPSTAILNDGDAPVSTSVWLGSRGYYEQSSKCFGFMLRSMYFMRDNDAVAPYVAMNVGVRAHRTELTYSYQELVDHNLFEEVPFVNRLQGSRTVVPLGLSLGVRAALDHGYSDVHFSIGYQIGRGDELVSNAPYDLRTDASPLRTQQSAKPLRMAGLTYGFGWAFGFGSTGR